MIAIDSTDDKLKHATLLTQVLTAQSGAVNQMHDTWFDVLIPGQLQHLSRSADSYAWINKLVNRALHGQTKVFGNSDIGAIASCDCLELKAYLILLGVGGDLEYLAQAIFWKWCLKSLRTMLIRPAPDSVIQKELPEAVYIALLESDDLDQDVMDVVESIIGACYIERLTPNIYQEKSHALMAVLFNIWPSRLSNYLKVLCDYDLVQSLNVIDTADTEPVFLKQFILNESFHRFFNIFKQKISSNHE